MDIQERTNQLRLAILEDLAIEAAIRLTEELEIAVELSEALGVAIAVGNGGLTVLPNLAERTVNQLRSLLKPHVKGLSKLRKDALVTLAIALWKPQEVAKRTPTRGKSKRKRA